MLALAAVILVAPLVRGFNRWRERAIESES
jgi:hypothetical protein